MSDTYVTVASYSIPMEAQLAAGRLEEEGIDAVVAGGLAADTFGLGIGGLGGTAEVRVPEAQAEKAHRILAACAGELHAESGWEEGVDTGADVWVCSLCGEPVALEEGTCPACQTPRDAIQGPEPAITGAPLRRAVAPERADKLHRRDQLTPGEPPLPEHELIEEGPDLPAPETFLADDLVRRAFRCAVFGFVFLPSTCIRCGCCSACACSPAS